jgi:signal transduction histidine kinase
MTSHVDPIGEEGLQFFGTISASISHEIKNALAVINENAGLVSDFCALAEKGKPVDQERIKSLVTKVLEQVRRADDIVRSMNRFAHSVDDPLKSTDLGDLAAFVARLSQRAASMRGISLHVEPGFSSVHISTRPFFAENIIWLCLDFAMGTCDKGDTLTLTTESIQQGGRIRFRGLQHLKDQPGRPFPTERGKALLDVLSAEISADGESGELTLTLMHLSKP